MAANNEVKLVEEFRRIAATAKDEQKPGSLRTLGEAYQSGIAAGVEMAMERTAQMLEATLD